MAKLIFSMITSLDGFIEDEQGRFDWGAPPAEVFGFVNELIRPVGTYLYGRRMYETMVYWENVEDSDDESIEEREFTRLWRAANKVVYSTTLNAVSSSQTRLERTFDPVAIQELKDRADQDVTIAGPTLAASAFQSRLIDEIQLFLTPIVLGGGKSWLPPNCRLNLELVDEHRFPSGVVFLRYNTLNVDTSARTSPLN